MANGLNKTTTLRGEIPFQLFDVLNGLIALFGGQALKTKRQQSAAISLMLIVAAQFMAMAPAFAQTKPAQTVQSTNPQGDSQVPSQDGQQTQNTVPNPYEDAVGNLYKVDQAVPTNQNNINDGVTKILTGNYAPVVFQAAEQGQGGDVQKAANNILNASLGSVNDTYRGLHQWFKDDLVGNLFSNIGQLIGKWLSELIDGWIADTAQFLAKFLRVFVLNPNIAVNGLNGQQNDGISPYIRQGADIMYGIAVDLLLLLFILCIWKFWADASWGGAGNLMGPVGRLIFTAGLLLAWPTIYAFEIQISNEMIKAIYFNSADQVLMLDYALAQAVKGGVIAAGAGATSVFAPLLANLTIPVAGQFVGQLFYFASTMIFTILGGILIAELVYILILKAVQTALLTAQYMFAPIFLVFFATPDTESYATGYVRAFVETSLWTFVWVGLLKVMTIVLFSNFNPWGKILISIGVLQLMIQVPSFLGRAQISPVSDFVTAGLVFGTVSKAITGLGSGLTSAIGSGVGWFTDGRFADKGLNQTKDAPMTGLPNKTQDPKLLHSLNSASQTERERNKSGPGFDPTMQPPPMKTPGMGDAASSAAAAAAAAAAGKNLNAAAMDKPGMKPEDKPPIKLDPSAAKLNSKPPEKSTTMPTIPVPPSKPATGATGGITAGVDAALKSAAAAADGTGAAAKPELPNGPPPDGGGKPPVDSFQWAKADADGFNQKNLIHVPTRKWIGAVTAVNGAGITLGQKATSALGSTANGVQRLNIANGASESEMAHAVYSAGFANQIASEDPARDAARKAAMQQNGHQPQGILENAAANWLSNTGSSWNKTALSKQRFQQSMFEAAVKGSQAYVSRQKGNAYTDYLRASYGEWGDEQDAMAVHLMTNPNSSESPWNRNVGPATDALVSSGIPIGADTRGAMQNPAIQGLHPSRRKQAVFAALSYTYQNAKALYGNERPDVFSLGHGEMARALPDADVANALTMYQYSGQADLNSTMAPSFMAATSGLAAAAKTDFGNAYQSLATAAPYQARRMGYIGKTTDLSGIHSFSDLSAVIVPSAGQTHGQAMQVILEASSANLATMEAHKVPMSTITNPTLAPEIFSALSHLAPQGLQSVQGSRALNVVAKNLSTVGAPHTAQTIEAMYSYENNGGRLDQLDQAHIVLASRAYSERGAAGVSPHVIEVAHSQGYGNDPGGNIPWGDIAKTAMYYQSGKVTDYRLAGVVGQLVNNGISVDKQNIQLAVESISANNGHMDADHLRAVIRLGNEQAVKSASSAPIVLETYARAQASAHGINHTNMNLGDVMKQLESTGGSGYSTAGMAQQIIQLTRQGGKFSDHQLQDPQTMQILVNQGNSHPYAPQAINVVTQLVGSTEAMNHPEYIRVVEEYLDNDGKMGDMTKQQGSLNAALKLAEARAAGSGGAQAADWNSVKINPSVLRLIQRDPGYSISDSSLSPDLIEKILRTSNRPAGGGGGGYAP